MTSAVLKFFMLIYFDVIRSDEYMYVARHDTENRHVSIARLTSDASTYTRNTGMMHTLNVA